MPFKSKAQRRFMYAAEARGELPKGTAARWQKETGKKKLPERVKTAAFELGLLHAMAKVASERKTMIRKRRGPKVEHLPPQIQRKPPKKGPRIQRTSRPMFRRKTTSEIMSEAPKKMPDPHGLRARRDTRKFISEARAIAPEPSMRAPGVVPTAGSHKTKLKPSGLKAIKAKFKGLSSKQKMGLAAAGLLAAGGAGLAIERATRPGGSERK